MNHISTLIAFCCVTFTAWGVSTVAVAQSPAETQSGATDKVGEGGKPEIEIDQIVQRIKEQEHKARNFRVKTSADVIQRPGLKPDGPDLTRKITTTFAVDERGRIRSAENGGRPGQFGTTEVHELKEVAAFDGKLVRMLRGKTNFDWGYIGPDVARIPREVDPREYLFHYFQKPLSSELTPKDYRVAGYEVCQGRPVVSVVSEPTVNNGDARQVRLLLDPAQDYTPLVRGVWIQFGNEGDWHQYSRTETSEHQKSKAGVWLPKRGQYTSLLVNSKQTQAKQAPKIAWQYTVKFEEWELDPKFTDEDFSLEFPKGIFVQDESGKPTN